MPDEMVTFFAARRGEETEEMYVRLGPGEDYPWWRLEMVTGGSEPLPEPTRPVRVVTTDPDGISDNELRRLANQRLGWPACAGCGTALTRDDSSAECNRCVTTDPGRQVEELRARVAYLEGRLADERAAHAKTQDLAGVWPAAGLSAAQMICSLAIGHAIARGRSTSLPTLFAEADQIAARIHDGSVPDAG